LLLKPDPRTALLQLASPEVGLEDPETKTTRKARSLWHGEAKFGNARVYHRVDGGHAGWGEIPANIFLSVSYSGRSIPPIKGGANHGGRCPSCADSAA
jgi:hypothetical protein